MRIVDAYWELFGKEDIKKVVDNPEWQRLRVSLKGTWNSEEGIRSGISKLRVYLGDTKNWTKLRRVQNYLAALRGVHHSLITKMRKQVNDRLSRLKE